MAYEMVRMNVDYAKEIINWRYEDILSIYDLNDNEETLNELMTKEYYAVLDNKRNLIGFFCVGEAAIVPYGKTYHVYDEPDYLDIGLGMNPKLVGKRKGYEFLLYGLSFFKKAYKTNKFRLTVFDFNKKAIHIYHKAGFKIENYFKSKNEYYFLVMTLVD